MKTFYEVTTLANIILKSLIELTWHLTFCFMFFKHGVLTEEVNLRSNRVDVPEDRSLHTFLTEGASSSVITLDIDTVLREHLRFLTESVTQSHNRSIVWLLTSAEIHFRPEETKCCDQCPFVQIYKTNLVFFFLFFWVLI